MDCVKEINDLKKKKNAVILAHYYQTPEIQEVADYLGDSLDLARKAQKTTASIIVFAGVHFMAEGAKILNPEKKVLIPDLRAGCSLADSCPPSSFSRWKSKFKNPYVISYINCSAEIKAMSDLICTSTNAIEMIQKAPKDRPLLFAPDQNLGNWLQKQTGIAMEIWPGACIVHETFSEKKILNLQVQYPDAEIIAHPECELTLLEKSHFVGSTSALLRYITESKSQTFIVATEEGILHQMKKKEPEKTFIPAPPTSSCECNQCPYMKLNTLEKIKAALENESPEIPKRSLHLEAKKPLKQMLEWSS
ncbi:MAG: quinolinate synthase [Bdellovibrionaceae bacterium]|nr:quinolinate synthase [Pseudobdellovibrionaceae bacterium]